jgi:hypothetical protein
MWKLEMPGSDAGPDALYHLTNDDGVLCWSGAALAEALGRLAGDFQQEVVVNVVDMIALYSPKDAG